MKFSVLSVCLFALLCFQGAAPAPAQQTATAILAQQIQQIEAAIQEWMTKTKAPALSVAVVTENQLRWAKGFGLADLENQIPATATTAYRLASITKSLTATAIMQLVEKGKIDLDAPIQKYCPAFPEKQWTITVRHLLTHQSGIRHHQFEEVLSTKHFNDINSALNVFKDSPLLHEPGAKYSYTTPGYVVLGCIIEGASGMKYSDYLRENILKPAQMNDTQVDNVYSIILHRARGYRKTSGNEIENAPLLDTSGRLPGGGLVSTVEDLARFAIALQSSMLVKKETLAEMWTRPKTKDGKQQDYAIGWLVADLPDGKLIRNDGSQAGTRTFLLMRPDQGYAVALMTNLERAQCEELAPKIYNILIKHGQ